MIEMGMAILITSVVLIRRKKTNSTAIARTIPIKAEDRTSFMAPLMKPP
jgi:hypothetical protein